MSTRTTTPRPTDDRGRRRRDDAIHVRSHVGAGMDSVLLRHRVTSVAVNGVAVSNWSLIAPNLLSRSPPAGGATITASFAYAFVCRFLEDVRISRTSCKISGRRTASNFGAFGNEDGFLDAHQFPDRRARQPRHSNRLRGLLHIRADRRSDADLHQRRRSRRLRGQVGFSPMARWSPASNIAPRPGSTSTARRSPSPRGPAI